MRQGWKNCHCSRILWPWLLYWSSNVGFKQIHSPTSHASTISHGANNLQRNPPDRLPFNSCAKHTSSFLDNLLPSRHHRLCHDVEEPMNHHAAVRVIGYSILGFFGAVADLTIVTAMANVAGASKKSFTAAAIFVGYCVGNVSCLSVHYVGVFQNANCWVKFLDF